MGAYIKKYDLMGRISVQKKFVGYLVCVALTWLWQLNAGLLGNGLKDKSAYENFLLSYISPTIVLSSIFLLTIFSEVKFGPQFKNGYNSLRRCPLGYIYSKKSLCSEDTY